MSQTYEEEIASWAAAWAIAESNFQEAFREFDRARTGYDSAREFRDAARNKLMECVGRNIPKRCVQLATGTLVLIDINQGISVVDPIRAPST